MQEATMTSPITALELPFSVRHYMSFILAIALAHVFDDFRRGYCSMFSSKLGYLTVLIV